MNESFDVQANAAQRIWLHIFLCMGAICFNVPAIAQVIPDATLGAERSQVNSNVSVPGGTGDRIDGGALRGANLFHSFQEFNVNTGQRVYFANPATVQNIFSRVTGGNLSTINGTLGVLGNANLFLLNPNGILFGPNAQLDIRGSFLATTANRFTFPDGSSFGATDPQAAPLLSMSVPVGVQYGATPTGTIQNQGNLTTGQDLTLAANNLDLQGQLQAGRDLNLQAQNAVQIRDTTTQPFLAQSGRNLTIQGNQMVDILALNHPTQTPFVSGGSTTLISNNSVSADAHFSSGGNFSVRTPTGTINNLVSRFDPVFDVAGDYAIGDYTGASLQVTAGGNITFGNVEIDDLDPAVNPNQPAFILNAGGNITGTGTVSTTVPDGNLLVNFTSGGATSIGQITTSGGDVYIQAQGGITAARIDTSSSSDLAGDVNLIGDYTGASLQVTAGGNISFGNVVIDDIDPAVNPDQPALILNAGGKITGTGAVSTTVPDGNLLVRFTSGGATSVGQITTDGGNVHIKAQGEITTGDIDVSLFNEAGSVDLDAVGDIRVGNIKAEGDALDLNANGIKLYSRNGSIFINNATLDTNNSDPDGYAGNISIEASKDIEITNNSKIESQGNYGQIFIRSDQGSIRLDNSTLDTSNSDSSGVAGDIYIDTARNLDIANGSKIQTEGKLGIILVGSKAAPEKVTVSNSTLSTDSQIISDADSGVLSIQGTTIAISNSTIYTNAYNGTAGDVIIQATADHGTAIALTNTLVDAVAFGSQGKTGTIILDASNRGNIILQGQGNRIYTEINGDQSTDRYGDQPNVGIGLIGGDISIDNYSLDSTVNGGDGGITLIDGHSITLSNGAKIITDVKGITGSNAGSIFITGDSLALTGGSQVSAKVSKDASGTGGNINIDILGLTSLSGDKTRIANSVEAGAIGSGGSTTIKTNSLLIKDGADIESSTSGRGNAGKLSITAQDEVLLQNGNISSDVKKNAIGKAGGVEITADRFSMSSPGSAIINTRITGRVDSGSQGNGGNITINARSATLDNSAISFSTSGAGNAGTLKINAQDLTLRSDTAIVGDVGGGGSGQGGVIRLKVAGTLLMDGATDPGVNIAGTGESTRITAGIGSGGSGQGGDIEIQAGTFLMQNGAIIKNSTRGSGNAGAVKISAEQVKISGSVPQSGLPSGLFTSTSSNFKAGDIAIEAETFQISNGGVLNAQSTGNGDGGNIRVNATRRFEALTGGQLITSTFGAGVAGNIEVNAPQVTIAGQGARSEQRLTSLAKFLDLLNPASEDALKKIGSNSGLFANAIALPSTTKLGKGGDITIKASNVLIQDNAGLQVNSQSSNLSANASASAGTIKITANQLKLDKNTFITAETNNGNGGNIQLSVRDLLLMRRNSQISTTAGSSEKGGNGGKITINAPKGFLVAVPSENSDIIANAFGGKGGTIQISANRVFGLQTRSGLSPEQLKLIRENGTSDISASSDVGQDGQVTISSLKVDPAQGLTELPVDVVDPSSLIAQGCQPDNTGVAKQRSEFVITGRGGLPPSVNDLQTGGGIAVPWVQQTGDSRQQAEAQPQPEIDRSSSDQPLVEAQGIVITPDGTPLLTTQVSTTAPHPSGLRTIRCRDRNPNPFSYSSTPPSPH